jgi:hypothetical protein
MPTLRLLVIAFLSAGADSVAVSVEKASHVGDVPTERISEVPSGYGGQNPEQARTARGRALGRVNWVSSTPNARPPTCSSRLSFFSFLLCSIMSTFSS